MKKKTLIFLIALIFSFIPFYRIFFKNGIIANIDFAQFFLFNPNFLERYPYVWREYFSGTFNVFYIVNPSALFLISSFFSFLGLSVLWINRFWLVFPLFLYILSVYFFIKTFLKEFNFSLLEIILILAFAVFSPLTSHYLSLGWQEAYFLPLAGTFFMFSFFFKFLESFTFRDLIFALLFSLLSTQLMHFFIFANICIFVYVFFFKDFSFFKKMKIFLMWFSGLFFMNSWWIFPLVSSYLSSEFVNYTHNPIIDVEYAKSLIPFRDVLFLSYTRGTAIIQKYQSSYYLTIIKTIFPILFIFGYLQAAKNKKLFKKSLFLGTIGVLLIFFGAGAHPPFGKIFTWMFTNIPMFYMFRDLGKLGLLLSFVYGVFAVYFFTKFSTKSSLLKILGTLVIFIFLIVSSFPLFTGNLAGDLQPLKLPDEYLEINSVINNNKQDFKVLNLPMPGWCSKFSWMEDKEEGAQIFNPFSSLLNKPIIFDELKNTGLNSVQKLSVFLACEGDQNQLKLLPLLNIGKLIFQKDQLNKPVEFCPNEKLLKKVDGVFPKEKTGNFVNLYSLPDKYFLPHFYTLKNIVYTDWGIENLADILSFGDYEIRSAVYLGNADNADKNADNAESKVRRTLMDRADEIFVKADLENVIKEEDLGVPSFEVTLPYVRQKPGSFFYPLVLEKEKLEEWKVRKETEKLFEKHLFYASKRVSEIMTFGVNKLVLANYKEEMTNALKILKKLKQEGNKDFVKLLAKYEGTLWGHRSKINELTNYSLTDWEVAFKELEGQAEGLKIKRDFSRLAYKFDIPRSGKYSLFINGLTDYSLKDAENADRDADNADEGRWVKLEERNFEEGEQELVLPFSGISENLIDENLRIGNYSPDSIYRISFDYQSPGGGSLFVAEGKTGETAETQLSSTRDEFSHFEMFFKSSPEAQEAAVHLSISVSEEKNLMVERIYQPELILHLNADNADGERIARITPKITFVKINPTKYRVKVEGAKEPYTLVFSESFHQGWRLYIAENAVNAENADMTSDSADNRFGPIVASYFDGEIKEGTHKNIFLDRNTFETWGKKLIPEEQHLLVNGYANSWYISPEDAQGQENYEIIIEFLPQRYFYIGLFISGLTLVGCLGYLILNLFRKIFRKK